ncbi:hypothetical protein Hanom_Chr15g01337541 [Helianthus anomalus]
MCPSFILKGACCCVLCLVLFVLRKAVFFARKLLLYGTFCLLLFGLELTSGPGEDPDCLNAAGIKLMYLLGRGHIFSPSFKLWIKSTKVTISESGGPVVCYNLEPRFSGNIFEISILLLPLIVKGPSMVLIFCWVCTRPSQGVSGESAGNPAVSAKLKAHFWDPFWFVGLYWAWVQISVLCLRRPISGFFLLRIEGPSRIGVRCTCGVLFLYMGVFRGWLENDITPTIIFIVVGFVWFSFWWSPKPVLGDQVVGPTEGYAPS